ncbi:MAG: DNA repair protein RadA [Phycisphaerales bacterium]|nr:DNA repair protein RadA [Phycisphaerales bacterium]
MAKKRTSYACSACGSMSPRWMGKCPACGQWDTLEAVALDAATDKDPHRGLASEWGDTNELGGIDPLHAPQATPIGQSDANAAPISRLATSIGELDRVLGGGIVPGSVILLGGDPGIGKSTLVLQALGALARNDQRVLYVTSEESAEQVRLRAQRLDVGTKGADKEELFVLADTNLARIVEQARQTHPAVLVIDSIQMVYKSDLDTSPGSVAQLRRCCTELVYLAKASGMSVILIGHVTKEGSLAGPKLLEHLVDVVLSFEGDRYHAHRIVRAIKNRFGTTQEIGLFAMEQRGLVEVPDGASVAADALGESPRPGSAVTPTVTGSRCVLVELQALTAHGFPGSVKRKSSGVDASRLAMLIAVLEQRAGLTLYDRDVFASAVGGVRVVEPAADLALALAIAGAHTGRALPLATAAVGEVGLGGEVRPVTQLESRCREAARLGYKQLLVPKRTGAFAKTKLELIRVTNIAEALAALERIAPPASSLEAKPAAEQRPSRR